MKSQAPWKLIYSRPAVWQVSGLKIGRWGPVCFLELPREETENRVYPVTIWDQRRMNRATELVSRSLNGLVAAFKVMEEWATLPSRASAGSSFPEIYWYDATVGLRH